MRRILSFFLWAVAAVVGLGGARFGYFVYTPVSEVPRLSGLLVDGTIEVGGLSRNDDRSVRVSRLYALRTQLSCNSQA